MTVEEKKNKLHELKEYHKEFFEKNSGFYLPKMAYVPRGENEIHIGFFPSELKRDVDIYVEFVDRNYNIEGERILFKHQYNPHWQDEYKQYVSTSGFKTYIVPVSKLLKMDKKSDAIENVISTASINKKRTTLEVLLSIEKLLINLNKKF